MEMSNVLSLLFLCVWIAVAYVSPLGAATQNLLTNGGFEQGKTHWDCWGYSCDVTTTSHSGGKAVQVSGRSQIWQGPSQSVSLSVGTRYSVEGWIKLTNQNNKLLQYIEIEVSLDLGGGKKNYLSVARRSFLSLKDGWVHLQGDFVTPTSGLQSASVYVQGPDPGIDFLIDDMALYQITPDPNWKVEANKRIDKLRKSDIHFQVTTGAGMSASSVQIEINQTSLSFPFGTEVNARRIVSQDLNNRKYAQFLYDNFNWGVPGNALKWYEFEFNRGHPNYDWGMNAVKELRKHGIKVRAHNMLWAVEQFVPAWLKGLPQSDVRQIVAKHIKDTTLRYKGLVEHWDVNNELLHGNWYETKLNDTDYTKEVFRMIHQSDPNVKLFLNDYNSLGSGGSTEAYTQQGADYKRSNTYIYGMGVQSHFPRNIAPDPTMMKRRLDRLAEAGLPLWSTELDVQTMDENQRADWYETAIRVLYSHPAVEGIIMWGFWSEAHYAGEAASLVSGQEFRVNAAGKRYVHLLNTEWRTHQTHALSAGNQFTVRGFHGDYDVLVKVNGKVTQKQSFSLGKNTQIVNIQINNA